MAKTKTSFFSKLSKVVAGKSKVDDDVLDHLEEVLVASDVGVATTLKIIDRIEERVAKDKYVNTTELNKLLKEEIVHLLEENRSSDQTNFEITNPNKPHVVMVVGVNGVGKTTTIGKLAHQYKKSGFNVVLGAADTYRAAAIDQLAIWSERVGVPIIKKSMGSDPASVAFDTLKSAVSQNADMAIIDTAGRLHNKGDLMAELEKIARVIRKVDPAAPHETLLVLDATTGQNAHAQVETFRDLVDISGLIVTKLDGSARGWQQVISDLAAVPAQRAVPGHGPVAMAWPMSVDTVVGNDS